GAAAHDVVSGHVERAGFTNQEAVAEVDDECHARSRHTEVDAGLESGDAISRGTPDNLPHGGRHRENDELISPCHEASLSDHCSFRSPTRHTDLQASWTRDRGFPPWRRTCTTPQRPRSTSPVSTSSNARKRAFGAFTHPGHFRDGLVRARPGA